MLSIKNATKRAANNLMDHIPHEDSRKWALPLTMVKKTTRYMRRQNVYNELKCQTAIFAFAFNRNFLIHKIQIEI